MLRAVLINNSLRPCCFFDTIMRLGMHMSSDGLVSAHLDALLVHADRGAAEHVAKESLRRVVLLLIVGGPSADIYCEGAAAVFHLEHRHAIDEWVVTAEEHLEDFHRLH